MSQEALIPKSRLEAFSDAVIAIAITIMVLELKVPHTAEAAALKPVFPVFLSYMLSFLYLGIYWNNHHHLFHAAKQVNGRIMWANLHLLFWLSLIPFATGWIGEHPGARWPTVLYGLVLLLAAVAYFILQGFIVESQGRNSALALALGRDEKGKLSVVSYLLAVGFAFINPWVSDVIFVAVAIMWVVPDRRLLRTTG